MIEIYQNRREVYFRLSGRFRGRLSHLPKIWSIMSAPAVMPQTRLQPRQRT